MGKMPLLSLIGACSLGMLLTGCNNLKQNTKKPPYADGKADAGMGFTQRPKSSTNSLGSAGTIMADNSNGFSPSMGAGRTSNPMPLNGSSSGSSTFGGSGAGMMPPSNGSNTFGGGSPMSANPAGTGTTPGSMNSGIASSPPTSSNFSTRSPSASLQQIGGRGDSLTGVTNANFQAADKDLTPAMPMSGLSRGSLPPLPPPPSTSGAFGPLPKSSTIGSSTNSPSNTWPTSPPPSPSPSMSMDPPPPSNSAPSVSGIPPLGPSGSSGKTSTGGNNQYGAPYY